MAFFSQEEEKSIRLNEFSIIEYVHKKDSTAREIISYYETVNNNSYQHYASEWRKIDLDISDKDYKQRIFDLICAAIIGDNTTIHDMCKSDLEELDFKYDDINFNELDSINDNINFEELREFEFGFKTIYSDFWPSNAIRLKAYSDKKSEFYKNGKLSNFEYYLRSIYRQKVLSGEYDVQIASSGYQRDISIYRDTYFEGVPDNSFYLQVKPEPKNINYDEDDIIFQAREDAASPSADVNYNFFISFQSFYNKKISHQAFEVKKKTFSASSKEVKQYLQLAKLNEIERTNRYRELFNLYLTTYNQTYQQYAALTSSGYREINLPPIVDYSLTTFFEDVDDTFEELLQSSMNDMVKQCVEHYNKSKSDEYILSVENQIRNYYQEQLSSIFIEPKTTIKKSEIQKYEIPVLEEYKEKIDEFRNACMRKIDYTFMNEYPPVNKYNDYSFNIGTEFQGLDKRTVIEWAMEAGRQEDLSLHSIKLIRLKTEEFININCMNGDELSTPEDFGSHETNVIMERYAMIEQRLLSFGNSMTEIYLHNLRRNYTGGFKDIEWKDFEAKSEALIEQPLSTYFDTNFDIATVQQFAQESKDNYDSASETPFYTKMKNTAQQKIYDVNDRYVKLIEEAKEEYIKSGKRVQLNLAYQYLRIDIDRIIDEYMNLSNYYQQEFNADSDQEEIKFDKGKYYYFQTNSESKDK